jgi:transposase InsO family protein
MHHSDRGVQYAAADYVALLQEHKIQISMSRTGNPYDNAKAERFMRTLKYEEIYMNDYETLAEVKKVLVVQAKLQTRLSCGGLRSPPGTPLSRFALV